MTFWFLAFLAVIWIAFFLPGAVRARRRTPLPAATRFKRAMGFIAPPKPTPRHAAQRGRRPVSAGADRGRWVVVPHASERAERREALRRARLRRRRTLTMLASIATATAAAAVAWGGSWVEAHLMADGILVFYVAMLFETKRRQDERSSKVHRIPAPEADDVIVFGSARAGGQP